MSENLEKENVTSATKIYALGGIEEIGKNTYCIEHDDEIILVDCGIKFASDELLGIDGIIPNYQCLAEQGDKVKALFISHGHEDHIGGIPYFLKVVNCPVIYAPLMAAELIKKKLTDFKDIKNMPEIITYYDDTEVTLKNFKVSFCRVSHSIPDAFAIYVETPNGGILHTGDYRVDFCLEGEQVDLHKLAKIGENGVSVLMTETTNSEVPGFSTSEMEIYKEIDNILSNVTGRVFFTTFASNLSRIDHVIAIAINHGRKICLLGRAIENNVEIARKIGYLKLDDSDFISSKTLSTLEDHEIMIICTGSQGEEMAALNTIASNRHAWIGGFKPTDTIIFSSNPIPGNWASVQHLVNKLYKHGVTILENGPKHKLHASGHATAQEQQLIMQLAKPKYLIPIHGEYKMLRAIQKTASKLFFDPNNVIILKNGQVASLKDQELTITEEFVDATPCFVESHDANGSSAKLIQERQVISEEGIVSIAIVIDDKEGKLVSLPNIVTRGCFYACKSVPLIKKISYSIKSAIEEQIVKDKSISDEQIMHISQNISNYYIWRNKRRSPMVVSSILHLN